MNKISEIIEILDNHIILQIMIMTIIATIIFGIIVEKRTQELYRVQAEIVQHDYGKIYENINDWKIEKIEKFEKGI